MGEVYAGPVLGAMRAGLTTPVRCLVLDLDLERIRVGKYPPSPSSRAVGQDHVAVETQSLPARLDGLGGLHRTEEAALEPRSTLWSLVTPVEGHGVTPAHESTLGLPSKSASMSGKLGAPTAKWSSATGFQVRTAIRIQGMLL